jgi:hypothetical protein
MKHIKKNQGRYKRRTTLIGRRFGPMELVSSVLTKKGGSDTAVSFSCDDNPNNIFVLVFVFNRVEKIPVVLYGNLFISLYI